MSETIERRKESLWQCHGPTIIVSVLFAAVVIFYVVFARAKPSMPISANATAANQFDVIVPAGKFALPEPLIRTGQQDIVFRVEARDAEKVRGIAGQRNRRLRVTVE